MKKAVLAYSFSDKNAGDFSLTIATLHILVQNGYFVNIISRFTKETEEFKSTNKYFNQHFTDKYALIESPFRLDRKASTIKRLINNFSGYLISQNYIKNKTIIKTIEESDLVILCPGNLLRCESLQDYMRLKALDYPLKLARKFKKRYIIFPQSSSIIKSYGKKLLGKMINGSYTTFTREPLSYAKLKQYYPNANIIPSIDIAFLLLKEYKFKANNQQKSVAFTIRGDGIGGLSELKPVDKDLLKNELDKIIKLFILKKTSMTFVVQGTNADLKFTDECAKLFKKKYNINIPLIEEHDTDKLIDLYAEFDCLIGMRLHSIILAAVAGTPSYGLFIKEWGLKNPGMMEIIDLPFAILDNDQKINPKEIEILSMDKIPFQEKIKSLVLKEKNKFNQVLNKALNDN